MKRAPARKPARSKPKAKARPAPRAKPRGRGAAPIATAVGLTFRPSKTTKSKTKPRAKTTPKPRTKAAPKSKPRAQTARKTKTVQPFKASPLGPSSSSSTRSVKIDSAVTFKGPTLALERSRKIPMSTKLVAGLAFVIGLSWIIERSARANAPALIPPPLPTPQNPDPVPELALELVPETAPSPVDSPVSSTKPRPSVVPPSDVTGYRRVKNREVTPALAQRSVEILNSAELGDEIPFSTGDGKDYLARLETHTDPPGGRRPYPHKGVSLFVKEST